MVEIEAFDPQAFAAFKASRGAPPAAPAQEIEAFDPDAFAAFKARRSPIQGADPGALQIRVGGGERRDAAASFEDRFDAAPPMARAQAAPRVGGDQPSASISGDQVAAERLYAGLRGRADEALIGKSSGLNDATAALFGAGQSGSLNLAGRAAAGVATGLGWLEGKGFPGVSGYGDGERSFSENYDRFHDLRDAYGRQSPKSTLAGEVAGMVGTAPILPGLAGAPAATLPVRALQYGVTGGLYGAAGEAIDSGDPLKAAIAGGTGLAGGAVLGPIVEKVAPPVVAAASKALAPILDRFGTGAVVAAEGGFTPRARAVLINAGLDADNLPPQLAQHIETAFAGKGASEASLREAQAAEFGIPLTRGQATEDPRVLAQEARALTGEAGTRAQQIGDDFTARQADAVSAARDRVLGMAGGEAPRIETPHEGYEAIADRARQMALGQTERESIAQRGVDDALRAVRGRGGVDAIDGAEAAIQGVREAAGQAKAGYRAAYDDVAAMPHQFAPGALDRMGSRVRDRLGPDVPIDDVLTPAATRAIADLDKVPEIFGLAPDEGPNLQQVDQLRKRLVSYYGATAQNPTDRRAVARIMDEFDTHLQDAAGAGLLTRPTPRSPELPADGFPGMAGPSSGPAPSSAAGGAPGDAAGQPETLQRFLARGGGVPLDAEARAADLHRTYVPGHGTLARNDAPSWDAIRVRLAEEGFLPPGMDGAASSREVADWARNTIHTERTGGQPTVRMVDEGRVGARRAADTVSDQNADHLAMVDRQARRMTVDLEQYGLQARDLDKGALTDAAERMVLGHHVDAADAYEAALAAREASGAGRGGQAAHEVPFDGPTSVAASDALPIGDTAPLDAMQRARGLFREYSQAFKPRGPGDVAGQRLQRILERDASPNEVAGMLFGSPGTGKVQVGQIQTLARVRAAVGAGSEAWQATQQALIARHLGGEGRDLGQRLDYLLSEEGRPLMAFLSGQQQAGLRSLKGATRQLEDARQAMPDWIADLGRTGFDPNAVARSLFGGSGPIGARPGTVLEARAARGLLGPDSQEWAMLRQAAVQRLMDPATSAAKTIERLRDFTTGGGKGVAEILFNPEEIGHLRRLTGALASTVRPDGVMRTGSALETGRQAAAKALDLLAGALAFKALGPMAGAGAYKAKVGQRTLVGGLGAVGARRSFEGGAPSLPVAPESYALAAGNTAGRMLAPLGAELTGGR